MTDPLASVIPDLPDFVQQGPLALCSLADIAGTQGFTDPSQLTDAQKARIPYLLAKLCSLFRREAGRQFTPGTTTVDMMTFDGYIQLPDGLGDGGSVGAISRHGKALDPSTYSVDALDRVWITEPRLVGNQRPGSGAVYTVTYTHKEEVPWDVRATMAAAVARYLTIDPNSAVAQSTFLSAEGYHQRIAAWVADVVKLSPEDIALAQAYRPYRVNIIIHKMGEGVGAYQDWSQWQWGGVTVW